MGTNYYYCESKSLPCPTCGHQKEQIKRHIGKSSGGWCFSLRVYPDEGIKTLNDWIRIFNTSDGYIQDEYGEIVHVDDMLFCITQRSRPKLPDYTLGIYYKSEDDFFEKNNAVKGPNNLVRHKIDKNCVGHGEGTWDYITGDFS